MSCEYREAEGVGSRLVGGNEMGGGASTKAQQCPGWQQNKQTHKQTTHVERLVGWGSGRESTGLVWQANLFLATRRGYMFADTGFQR
jgi:hypothetical protein